MDAAHSRGSAYSVIRKKICHLFLCTENNFNSVMSELPRRRNSPALRYSIFTTAGHLFQNLMVVFDTFDKLFDTFDKLFDKFDKLFDAFHKPFDTFDKLFDAFINCIR